METLTVRTSSRTDLVEITGEVASAAARAGVVEGVCVVFVPHTTAGITLNENADPAAREDIASTFDRMVPWDGPYLHAEGNSAAHVKSSLVGHHAGPQGPKSPRHGDDAGPARVSALFPRRQRPISGEFRVKSTGEANLSLPAGATGGSSEQVPSGEPPAAVVLRRRLK